MESLGRKANTVKKIHTQVHISRLSSRVDGSIGITLATPELTPQERALFFELHNVNCNMVLEPLDTPDVPEVKIDRDVESKTPSERMRGVLYRIWEQEGMKGDFKDYYSGRMELLIEKLKEKLE